MDTSQMRMSKNAEEDYSGEIQNIAGIHPTRVCQETESGEQRTSMEEYCVLQV